MGIRSGRLLRIVCIVHSWFFILDFEDGHLNGDAGDASDASDAGDEGDDYNMIRRLIERPTRRDEIVTTLLKKYLKEFFQSI